MSFFKIEKTQAYAEFAIYGYNLDVNKLTSMLIPQTNYIGKSEDDIVKTNNLRWSPAESVDEADLWAYSTNQVATAYLEDRLEELIEVFREKTNEINSVRKMYRGCEVIIFIVVHNRQKLFPGIAIRENQISFLAEIGARLEFDIYT